VIAVHTAVPRQLVTNALTAAPTPAPQSMTSYVASQDNAISRTVPGDSGERIVDAVFECRHNGVTIFSDHRCGDNAAVRAIKAPNSMIATPAYVTEEKGRLHS